MIKKFIKDRNKLIELNKMIQNMNDQFSKESESMEIYQTEIPEINYIESTGSRSNKCEYRASELEDRVYVSDQLYRDTLKLQKI